MTGVHLYFSQCIGRSTCRPPLLSPLAFCTTKDRKVRQGAVSLLALPDHLGSICRKNTRHSTRIHAAWHTSLLVVLSGIRLGSGRNPHQICSGGHISSSGTRCARRLSWPWGPPAWCFLETFKTLVKTGISYLLIKNPKSQSDDGIHCTALLYCYTLPIEDVCN